MAEMKSYIDNHNHTPNPNKNSVREICHNLRTEAVLPAARPRQIISRSLRVGRPEISSLMPDYSVLHRNIQRSRQRNSFPYPMPSNAAQFSIPDEYKITFRNEQFLLSESHSKEVGIILIFGTARAKNILSASNSVYFDATFKTVPEIFFQFFTIHAEYHGSIVPCIFVLMEYKREECYRNVWDILCSSLNLSFSFSMCDFEKASINAFKVHFPLCDMSGCFFHFKQNMWKKFKNWD